MADGVLRPGHSPNMAWPLAATVLTSPRAVEVLHLIINVFVDTRQQMLSGAAGQAEIGRLSPAACRDTRQAREILGCAPRFRNQQARRTTVRDETEALTTSVLDAVKAHLADNQVRNEEVIAEIHRKMAETEKLRAEARKVHAEADALDIGNLRDRFELMKSIAETLVQANPAPALSAHG